MHLTQVREAIRAVDPAALVDIDPSGQALRVAAAVDADQVIQVPSVCCGG